MNPAILICLSLFSFGPFVPIVGQEGLLVVNGKTYKGSLSIDFDNNSVAMEEGSGKRVFYFGIERIVLGTARREEYLTYHQNEKPVIFKVLVKGKVPLFERKEKLFSIVSGKIVPLEQGGKSFFEAFGKNRKDIKNYAFAYNLSLDEKAEVISIFKYYNQELAP